VKSYNVLEEQWKKKEKKTLEENSINKVKEGILKVTIDRKESVVETRKMKDKKKVSFDDQIVPDKMERTYAEVVKDTSKYENNTNENKYS